MSINIGEHFVGGGRLLIESYKPGTKTPSGVGAECASLQSLTYTYEPNTIESWGMPDGRRERDAQMDVGGSRNLSASFNSFSAQAMAYALGGDPKTLVTAEGSHVMEEFSGVIEGSTVQLGVTAANPGGVRKITECSVMADGSELESLVDYVLDAEKGNIYFPAGSAVAGAEQVTVTYSNEASSRTQIISSGTTFQLPVRFLSNPVGGVGPVHDLFIPGAAITLNGDLTFTATEAAYRSLSLSLAIVSVQGYAPLYFDGKPLTL